MNKREYHENRESVAHDYLVTVTAIDPDIGKRNVEMLVKAKTAAQAKRIAHKLARDSGVWYITELSVERRNYND